MEECRESDLHQQVIVKKTRSKPNPVILQTKEVSSILTRGLTINEVKEIEDEYQKMVHEQPPQIDLERELPNVPKSMPTAKRRKVILNKIALNMDCKIV